MIELQVNNNNNNNNECEIECYICASIFPVPWKSDCNCIDRFIHKECLEELIFKTGKLNCPVCLIPYRNVNSIVTKKFNVKTNLTYSFCFCSAVTVIFICSITTLIAYDNTSNKNKLFLGISGFSFVAISTIGYFLLVIYILTNGGIIKMYKNSFTSNIKLLVSQPNISV
tara:strand:+ start:80 stop:589 length:510 start_codon:yes stop_codon:yes gene_type:complete